MTNEKAVQDVLFYINEIVEYFKDSEDAVNLPLQFKSRGDWGGGIYCSKGLWVTSCDPELADEVLARFKDSMQ